MCDRDRAGSRRADARNSVYFPDRVVPMLPDHSNDLCSWCPANRARMAVRMIIGSDGAKRSHSFIAS